MREETRCRHMGCSFRLTARVLLYAPSHRQVSTYHSLCYTSRGALAGMWNSSMCVLKCLNSEQNVICLQSLKEEFKQQEDLLKELDQHAKDYKLQGKLEAGARLEQQIQLLKVAGSFWNNRCKSPTRFRTNVQLLTPVWFKYENCLRDKAQMHIQVFKMNVN